MIQHGYGQQPAAFVCTDCDHLFALAEHDFDRCPRCGETSKFFTCNWSGIAGKVDQIFCDNCIIRFKCWTERE